MSILFDFSQKHPLMQFLILLFLMAAGALFSILFAQLFGSIIWGKDIVYYNITSVDNLLPEQINFQKFMQFCNQIGMLLLPALFFAYLSGSKTWNYLRINNSGNLITYITTLLIVFATVPFISMLQEWNASISLPEWMHNVETWMKFMEDKAESLTQVFMATDSISILLLNIGLMAALPALAEELFFRGVMQNIFQNWLKNPAWAIVITAFIFSSFHLQFYGFFPRFILGVVLGALYVISGSLWVPIFAHFINNATVVVFGYWSYINTGISATEFGQTSHPAYIIISILATLFLFWLMLIYQRRNKKS